MINSKRRAPTIDGLLRSQEEPQKRYRPSPNLEEHDDEGSSVDDCEDSGEESSEGESDVGPSSESSHILGSRVSIKPKLSGQLSEGKSSGASSSKNVTFLSLSISPPLLSALSKMALHTPTEIQRACIPPLLIGSNTQCYCAWTLLTKALWKVETA